MAGNQFSIPHRPAQLRQAAGLEHGQANLVTKGFIKLHAVGQVDISLTLPTGSAGDNPPDNYIEHPMPDIPTPLVVLPNRRLIPMVSVNRVGVLPTDIPVPDSAKILMRFWMVRLEGQDQFGGWWGTPLLPGGVQYRAFRMFFAFEPYYLEDQPTPPVAQVRAQFQLMEIDAP